MIEQSAIEPGEMRDICNEINQRYSPVAVTLSEISKCIALTRAELCEISSEISRDFRPKQSAHTPTLTVLPVAPRHLFVSWNLRKVADLSTKQRDKSDAYVLRVCPQEETGKPDSVGENCLEFTINSLQERRHLLIPEQFAQNNFTISLGISDEVGHFEPVASSQPVETPEMNQFCARIAEHGVFSRRQGLDESLDHLDRLYQ